MSDKVYVGSRVASLRKGREYEPFSRVTMWYDDEHYYTAGDDTGRELVANCRSATQEMVNNVLAQVKGYVYRPFEATGVALDPAAELGDAITIGGLYSVIAQTTEHFDALGLCDVSAPGEKEIDHEYPYEDPITRELKRRVKLGQSYYGTSITRREGLVIEKLIGEAVAARVVMNADKLAFYGPNNEEQLYFDPAEGVYKFRGALNVNDLFIVEKTGNAIVNGSMTINGSLIMNGSANWLLTRYSANKTAPVPNGWTEAWDAAWSNASTQVWAIYSYNGGKNWTQPMLVQGKDGDRGPSGPSGSDANVPAWVKAYTDSAQFNTLVTDEWVVSMNLFGSKIFGTEIYGGKITSDTTIDVGTDATIGRWLKLKSPSTAPIGILFNGDFGVAPCIWSENDKFITMSADYLGIIADGRSDSAIRMTTPLLDLTNVSKIEWGGNKQYAYFK